VKAVYFCYCFIFNITGYCLVMDYVENGSLCGYLKPRKDQITEQQFLTFALDIATVRYSFYPLDV